MRFKVDAHVTLKRTVNDPQGLTIKNALCQIGFEDIEELRAGKYIEIWLEADDAQAAINRVDVMCAKLLANSVIEQYRVEIGTENLKES